LRQPSFLVAVGVLLFAAIAFNTAVARLKLHFQKLPVPLRHDLDSLPSTLGPWLQVSRDEPLDPELQQVLDTDKYIFRDYINTTVFTPDQVATFATLKTHDERAAALAQIEPLHPEAVIHLTLEYYTGMVDTVAHIPDRCYVADGYEPSEYTEPFWDLGPHPLGKSPDEDQRVGVRFINFEDQTGLAKVPKSVCYFFHCNGHYEQNPLGVRLRLQDLRSKYGYYAKVELMTLLRDRELAASVMQDFLRHARPSIESLLPDWNAVTKS
jgi:hypothetical protein